MALTFEQARECVLREVGTRAGATEQVSLPDAAGRVLAEAITADRDYPPFARSARDGTIRAGATRVQCDWMSRLTARDFIVIVA